MRLLLVIILFTSLMAAGAFPVYSQQKIGKDLLITLDRSLCFGWCPSYSLTINVDGVVKFTPMGNPVYRGTGEGPAPPLEGTITADQLNVLLTEFQKIKFYSLSKHYGSAGKSKTGRTCPHYWTDSSSATISIINNGKKKTVDHYLGCEGSQILDDLKALETNIDETVDVKKWTSQYGWGVPTITDVQLKVEHGPPSKPQ